MDEPRDLLRKVTSLSVAPFVGEQTFPAWKSQHCAPLSLVLLVNLPAPVQGGRVTPTVHVLIHLLGDLLRVAEVRRRHRHPET